jgi:large subunit ribosomal protein L21
MFAIVEIAGQQFKVEKNRYVYVHRLQAEEGATVQFEKVLLTSDGDNTTVGTPYVAGTKITAKILSHLKGDKVIVFHKKRRKGYRKKNGFRQSFTKILVENIG